MVMISAESERTEHRIPSEAIGFRSDFCVPVFRWNNKIHKKLLRPLLTTLLVFIFPISKSWVILPKLSHLCVHFISRVIRWRCEHARVQLCLCDYDLVLKLTRHVPFPTCIACNSQYAHSAQSCFSHNKCERRLEPYFTIIVILYYHSLLYKISNN